ncbi:sulfatase, partial [Candidatus Omnitrophota bacterium]
MKSNIVLYVSDSLRQDFVGLYNPEHIDSTPCINKFGEESIIFDNAYSPSSWTRPSLNSLLMGLYPGGLNIRSPLSPYPKNIPSLLKILKDNGYFTCIITSCPFVHLRPFLDSECDSYIYLNRKQLGKYRAVGDLIFENLKPKNLKIKQPFFVLIWNSDTHDPYFNGWEKNCKDFIPVQKLYLNKNKIPKLKELYKSKVNHTDYFFGKFIEQLKTDSIFDNSLIVFTSDHGEGFNEHGFLSHRGIVFQEMIKIPLIIKFPYTKSKGLRIKSNVSLVDLFPTILEIGQMTSNYPVDGISLLETVNKNDSQRIIVSECSYPYSKDNISLALIHKNYKVVYKIESTSKISGKIKYNSNKMLNNKLVFLGRGFLFRLKANSFDIRRTLGSFVNAWFRRRCWEYWLK